MIMSSPNNGRPAVRTAHRAVRTVTACARRRAHAAGRRAAAVFCLGAAFGLAAGYPLMARAQSQPYGPLGPVPATLEAEHYDLGDEDVAFRDRTPGNSGGHYRAEGVDITRAGTATVVNNFEAGEWMAYTIFVPAAGRYDIQLLAATTYAGSGFHIEINGVDVTGPVVVPTTGGWNTFQWTGRRTVSLRAGRQVLKVHSNGQPFSLDKIRITRAAAATTPASSGSTGASRPYGGTPAAVPATLQAEHYDHGGEGVAYHDKDAARPGNSLRTNERVDIVPGPGGHVVNSFQAGEWMAYTINVPSAGRYDLSVRASSAMAAGGAFRITLDGRDVTGVVGVPNTGGWESFRWITKPSVTLPAGRHVLKLHAVRQYFNVDALRITRTAAAAPANPGASPKAGRQFFCTFAQSPSDCGFFVQQKAPGRATLVATARDGTTAVRLRTLPGDNNVAGSGPENERTDLALSTAATDCSQGKEAWWAHSVLFPSDFTGNSGGYYTVMDFHHTGSSGQANFHLDASRWDGRLHLRGYGGSQDANHYEVTLEPVVKNKWYDFVYHVRWSSGSDGFMRAWMNGRKVLDHRGPTLYAGQQCYLKLANYHSAYGQASSVIHDRIVRGTTPESVALTPLEGVND